MDTGQTQEQRIALENFLYLFSDPLAEVTLPKHPVSTKTKLSKRKDQIFGSEFVCSELLGRTLYESEMLLISAPIKIAVHKSCKKKMKHQFDSGMFSFNLSSTDGTCFEPTPNQPTYLNVVKALLSEATIVSLGPGENSAEKHIFHVANLGTRFPVDPSSRQKLLPHKSCRIREIFRLVHDMRLSGVQAEMTQLDVAFNIPSVADKLPQWSWERNMVPTQNETVFKNVKTEQWPLHDVTRNNHQVRPDTNSQKGTVRVKQKAWDGRDPVIIFGSDVDPQSDVPSSRRM